VVQVTYRTKHDVSEESVLVSGVRPPAECASLENWEISDTFAHRLMGSHLENCAFLENWEGSFSRSQILLK